MYDLSGKGCSEPARFQRLRLSGRVILDPVDRLSGAPNMGALFHADSQASCGPCRSIPGPRAVGSLLFGFPQTATPLPA